MRPIADRHYPTTALQIRGLLILGMRAEPEPEDDREAQPYDRCYRRLVGTLVGGAVRPADAGFREGDDDVAAVSWPGCAAPGGVNGRPALASPGEVVDGDDVSGRITVTAGHVTPG